MKTTTFDSLPLSAEMQKAIGDMGFSTPSPIQAATIPLILEGSDVVGQAQTGTGKTAAFGIPLIESIPLRQRHTSALVLCPTRELSLQVATELKKLAKYRNDLQIAAVYGGEPIFGQIKDLRRGAQIVVGTPGRIIDHLERGTLSPDNIEMVVLDEADEMLNRGFREDIERILRDTPTERQTVLFSATMPKPIKDIIHHYQRDPQFVTITRDKLTNNAIEQIFFDIDYASKLKSISNVLQIESLKTVMVFCNTKKKVDEVVEALRALGYKADAIHGDLSQQQRNRVLEAFRNGDTNILVATDVAARGLDISNVDAVFNYDIPMDIEYYVHRIGRTGRAGKSGKAYSFVTGRNEFRQLRQIEYYTKARIEKRQIPSDQEVSAFKRKLFIEKIKTIAENDDALDYQLRLVADFGKAGISPEMLAASLLKVYLPAEKKHAPPPVHKPHPFKKEKHQKGKKRYQYAYN